MSTPIQISTHKDSQNYRKGHTFDGFCGQCGLELNKSNVVGLCDMCFREAMQDEPDNMPAHPSEWEDR